MSRIGAGVIDDTWTNYGIEQLEITLNGESTGNHILTKNDEFVAVVGNHYRVLPNELALEIADNSARLTGLEPYTAVFDHGSLDNQNMSWVQGHRNAIQNGWKVHAFYTTGREAQIGRETVNVGVAIHNSIDGSMGFNVGIFTYRMICSNMVFAGFKNVNRGGLGRTLEYIYSRHTDSLTHAIEDLSDRIILVMEKAHLIVDSYEGMTRVRATEELIEKIRKSRISDKILPDYLKAEELEVSDLSEWDVYNDITEAIWHSPKTNMDTKMTYMDQLHRVMPVILEV